MTAALLSFFVQTRRANCVKSLADAIRSILRACFLYAIGLISEIREKSQIFPGTACSCGGKYGR